MHAYGKYLPVSTMGEDGEMEKGRGGGLTCEIASSTCRADWSVAEGIVELESFIC